MTQQETIPTILSLPRHLLIHNILLKLLSPRDCRALVSTSRQIATALSDEDELWRTLLEQRRLSWWTSKPCFPGAGSWKDVYMRSLSFSMLVIIQTLTRPHGPHLRLVVSRSTPLFALKRDIREMQLQHDGIALEDFDLINTETGESLEVAGNDSLPPQDLGRLLWFASNTNSSDGIGGGGAAPLPPPPHSTTQSTTTTSSSRRRRLHHRDAWRRYVSQIADGTLLRQVFVDSSNGDPIAQSPTTECETLIRHLEQTTELAELQQDNASSSSSSAIVDTLTNALERTHALLGPTGYKTWWRKHNIHPLLRVAMLHGHLPVIQRIRALLLFGKLVARTIFRVRFISDVLVRSFLTSGFALSFTRLCVLLFPMIWRTQVKSILDADFDLIFAFRLIRDVTGVTCEAFLPVLAYTMRVEVLRVIALLAFTKESWLENALVVLFAGMTTQVTAILRGGQSSSSVGSNIFPHYVLSSLAWALFSSRSEHALSVSLPVYLYALPLVSCAIVLRLRVFLTQSYLSLVVQY